MTAPDDPPGVDRGRLAAGAFVIAVLLVLTGLLLYYLLRPDPNGSAAQPLPAATPTAQPAPSEPTPAASEPTPAPEHTPTAEPTELPTGDLAPGTTAIFHGQPATGPWQTIGSVSEITADGAGPAARFGYEQHWQPHGLPDDLWDELVAHVSLEAIELGEPLNRPVLDAGAGSEILNARAGLHWDADATYGRGLAVGFDAIYDHDGVGVWRRWMFLIHPDTYQVLAAAPRVEVTEDEASTLDEATDRLLDQVWPWVLEQPQLDP